MEKYLQRLEQAQILIQQEKYALAETRLAALMEEGHLASYVFFLMVLVKLGLDKRAEARTLIQTLLQKEPDNPATLNLLARLELVEENYEAAHQAINAAIRLDPEDADQFSIQSRIFLSQSKFKEALESANRGLALDPQDVSCLNLRSMALVKAGREEEAALTIDKALAENPDNADTHANYGYAYLHQGDHKKALEHYKTALQIDPMNDFAKAGMLEAMKAKFWPYRMLLQLAFRLERLGKNGMWAFLIGGYVLIRVLRGVAKNVPELQIIIVPIIILLFIAFLSTWILGPLMNLYMLTNPYGRLTLDEEDKAEARMVGAALGLSVLSGLLYLLVGVDELLLFAGFSFLMMIPFGSMNSPATQAGKKKLKNYTIFLGITGLASLFFEPLLIVFLLAFFAYQWYANYVIIKNS